MKDLFADTFYFLAWLSLDDAAHDRAVDYSRTPDIRIFTTAWVLTEVADALSAPGNRATALTLFDRLRTSPTTTIVPPSEELFDRGLELYSSRPDKAWSLTDCISFVVMRQHSLTEALTGDRHFEQAGFKALLLEPPQ